MHLSCRAQIVVSRPRAEVFDFAVAAEHLPEVLKKWGPIPGVVEAQMEGGAPLAPGARRRISMSDGTKLTEEIVALERPAVHGYRWSGGLKPPFSIMVRSAEATWRFEDQAGATAIDWTYRFELTSPLAYPLAAPTLLLFERWMVKSLERLRAAMAS